jgi:hypothetical protein
LAPSYRRLGATNSSKGDNVKRLFLVLALSLLLLLAAVGTATAGLPAGQITGQSAGSGQTAGSLAGTAQQEPSNTNGSVRVLSKGDDGSVSQSNEATSNATAANQNKTSQDADQTGGSGDQVIGQAAQNSQAALGVALTAQKGASNVNTPTHVLAPGDAGTVSQSNTASSDAAAGNTNTADQSADQDPAGGDSCCGGSGSQIVGQSADNQQDAAALAATDQENPSNQNVSVRVLSPGDDGSVSQSNEATSNATAANENTTKQDADQSQSGGSCKCGSAGDQVIGQSADSSQDAEAAAITAQKDPSNKNISVRVLSPGDNGDVSQSNVASSDASAGNTNKTNQDADQSQSGGSCKCGSDGTQLIGQSADSQQNAAAVSATSQENPSNKNVSVRVLSPGDDGSVSQSNEASSSATAANENTTKQDADQDPTGGSGFQAIGQSASNDQNAFALGLTFQKGASNENDSVRVLSPGDSGDVSQSNVASSNAAAGNTNKTDQDADQSQSGGSCKCGSDGAQFIGQSADSKQGAAALAATIQKDPSNKNDSIRVLSHGDDGSVSQSNEASSNATAANENTTKQDADQEQAGGSGLQVIGQESKNGQFAAAAALTAQIGASNENAPLRVLSRGDGGDVTQSNDASSNAMAGNTNWTNQDADQSQSGGSCKCGSDGIQAIGQSSQNWQGAKALAVTLQIGLKPPCTCEHGSGSFGNSNDPKRVLSPGADGDVEQSNDASSNSTAGNWNWTKQDADQDQGSSDSCGCRSSDGIQAIGQQSISGQFAASLAATLQLAAANGWAPDRKDSPGKNGDLTQEGQNSANDGSGGQSGSEQSNSQSEGR